MGKRSFTIIASVGGNEDSLFCSVGELQVRELILLAEKKLAQRAIELKVDIEAFKVQVRIVEIPSSKTGFDIVNLVKAVVNKYGENDVIVNTASGTSLMGSLLLCSAFLSGVRAFTLDDKGHIVFLPVVRYPFGQLLTPKKLDILKSLDIGGSCNSLEELSRRTDMSLPLISYHINGNQKSNGVKSMGLVDTNEKKGRVEIGISELGRFVIGCCERP